MRRGAPSQSPRYDYSGPEMVADPRFPEVAGVASIAAPAGELRSRLVGLAGQRFSGYWHFGQAARVGGGQGIVLFHEGQPIQARVGAADGAAALGQLLARQGADDVALAAHPLGREMILALAATFQPPHSTQPLGNDSSEVALILRDLAGVRHSGIVQVSAQSLHLGTVIWARILMFEGKILGVYSSSDRQLKASLADVGSVLVEATPQLQLFALQGLPVALPLPREQVAPPPERVPGATAARDELLETDLIWFMSRFERAFGRLKERRDPEADLLRAFGELANELAGFVAALPDGSATPAEAQGVVAAELARGRATGAIAVDYNLGKAGIDAAALAKGYGAQPRRSPSARRYFVAASTDILALIERLMERMLAAFYDPTSAAFAREGCETLLREVRGGLGDIGR